MDFDCKSVFNRLSQADRLKIKGAATTRAITSFMRDDTKAHPWRYPFYAAFILTLTTPLPFFGAGTILMGGIILWARMGKGETAQALNGRLKNAFNGAAVCEDYKNVIEPRADKPGAYRVKNLALAWEAAKMSFADTRDATIYAGRALKKLVMK